MPSNGGGEQALDGPLCMAFDELSITKLSKVCTKNGPDD